MGWRRAGLVPARERFDNGHVSATAGARRSAIGWFVGGRLNYWHVGIQQLSGQCETVLARGTGQQAIVPDAVEASGQDMDQEPADKLVARQRHDLLALLPIAAIVLEPECDVALIEVDKAPVRDGDAVCIARQIGEHGLRSGEGWLGIDHPTLFADWGNVAQ